MEYSPAQHREIKTFINFWLEKCITKILDKPILHATCSKTDGPTQLFALVLDTEELLTYSALMRTGLFRPENIYIPQPNPRTCELIRQMCGATVTCESSHRFLEKFEVTPTLESEDRGRQLSEAVEEKLSVTPFSFVWLDYCGTWNESSKASRRRQKDIAIVFENLIHQNKRIVDETMLVITLSQRGAPLLYENYIVDNTVVYMKSLAKKKNNTLKNVNSNERVHIFCSGVLSYQNEAVVSKKKMFQKFHSPEDKGKYCTSLSSNIFTMVFVIKRYFVHQTMETINSKNTFCKSQLTVMKMPCAYKALEQYMENKKLSGVQNLPRLNFKYYEASPWHLDCVSKVRSALDEFSLIDCSPQVDNQKSSLLWSYMMHTIKIFANIAHYYNNLDTSENISTKYAFVLDHPLLLATQCLLRYPLTIYVSLVSPHGKDIACTIVNEIKEGGLHSEKYVGKLANPENLGCAASNGRAWIIRCLNDAKLEIKCNKHKRYMYVWLDYSRNRPFTEKQLCLLASKNSNYGWKDLNELFHLKIVNPNRFQVVCLILNYVDNQTWEDAAIDYIVHALILVAHENGYQLDPQNDIIGIFKLTKGISANRVTIIFKIGTIHNTNHKLTSLPHIYDSKMASNKFNYRYNAHRTRIPGSRSHIFKLRVPEIVSILKSFLNVGRTGEKMSVASIIVYEPGFHYICPSLIKQMSSFLNTTSLKKAYFSCYVAQDEVQKHELLRRYREDNIKDQFASFTITQNSNELKMNVYKRINSSSLEAKVRYRVMMLLTLDGSGYFEKHHMELVCEWLQDIASCNSGNHQECLLLINFTGSTIDHMNTTLNKIKMYAEELEIDSVVLEKHSVKNVVRGVKSCMFSLHLTRSKNN